MGTNAYIFRNAILDYIEFTPIQHERKGKKPPDLIQYAIDDGEKVKSFEICDWYTNINSEEDLEEL